MKTRAIGEVSRGGGFPRLIKDVQEWQEPLLIMKNNEAVAIVIPSTPEFVKIFESSVNFGKAFASFAKEGLDRDLEVYLVSQVMAGLSAKILLSTSLNDVGLVTLERELVHSAREAIRKAMMVSMQNSSEGSRSVSPMTTTSADVSEVKQEELPLGGSSLSRKRGRPKKTVSSPQKRKIGTKRETSAS